jgi:predicted MFS family arabinose efflux permease
MPPDCPARRISGMKMFFSVFLPFALGHYLSLLLRNMNSVLAPNLVLSLGLDSAQLGLLTSAFFFTYALVQLPVGIALDRYGPRKVQLVLMAAAAAGCFLFAKGQSFAELVAARALVGLGLGGCFMSAVKVISSWIAPGKVPSVHGYLIAVGGLGSATATLPVRQVLQYTDWRGLFLGLALLIAGAGLLIWMVTPREAPPRQPAVPTLRSLREVYRNPQFRRTISLMLIPHAVFFGMQGLWIGRWLSQVAHFSDDAVAYLLYLSMAAVIFGAIAVGLGTERAARRGIQPLDMAACGIALFMLVQAAMICDYVPSYQLLAVMFTLVGTITGMEYAIVAQSLPRELTGRASTCLNLLIFIGAFLVQAGFGQVLGLWRPDVVGHYPAIAYRIGFAVLLLVQLPGLLVYAWRRRPQRTMAERIITA